MKNLKTFDSSRNDFMPYGLTCERWTPQLMPRFDRHNEIEINFFPHSGVSYLISDCILNVPPRRMTMFWGLMPHKIIHFSGNDAYYVCTIPLSRFLEMNIPKAMQNLLFEGRMLTTSTEKEADFDERLILRWYEDLEKQPFSKDTVDIVLLEMRARLLRFCKHFEVMHQSTTSRDTSKNTRKLYTNEVDIVSQLAIYIAKNYMNPIKSSDIGKAIGIHPDYANTLFKKAFGCTMHDYLIKERISHVERLLITTDRPITDIAFSCGFNTISRFNATFLSVNGCTPREYRTKNDAWK
ncbi:MAG: helix-turn-helix domain-containing protein [Bacteroidaceae bacterium]|nr:helix-turn-helix domain-containing protein [Bacteroidaceae bacterium]